MTEPQLRPAPEPAWINVLDELPPADGRFWWFRDQDGIWWRKLEEAE